MSVKSKISGKDALHKSKVISKVERKRLDLAKDAQQEEKSWSVKWRMTRKTLTKLREGHSQVSVKQVILQKTIIDAFGKDPVRLLASRKNLQENCLTNPEGGSNI